MPRPLRRLAAKGEQVQTGEQEQRERKREEKRSAIDLDRR
jgi:hypothetical protein